MSTYAGDKGDGRTPERPYFGDHEHTAKLSDETWMRLILRGMVLLLRYKFPIFNNPWNERALNIEEKEGLTWIKEAEQWLEK